MKLQSVGLLAVQYEPFERRSIRVGRLALRDHRIFFEYDAAFVARGLELSPFKLGLKRGLIEGDPNVLGGLMGVFDDSLPDGWGRLLIDRSAAAHGLSAMSLTPLDRLALVGSRGMGALRYEPETLLDEPAVVKLADLANEAAAVQLDADDVDLERLIAIGGSPKGARPKALVQLGPDGTIHFGAGRSIANCTAWLVKFPASVDPKGSASAEHAYAEMARAAKIAMPATRLLRPSKRHEGYFAAERFDRSGKKRVHVHTLGGLLHLPPAYAALDYVDVLKVTRGLTRNEADVAEMFRRACFNVLAHNRDDHSRNITYMMDDSGAWRLAPAYDLTFSSGPRDEHQTLICNEGRTPSVEHLKKLASEADIKRGRQIIDEVRAAVSAFAQFAEAAEVPPKLRDQIAAAIGVATKSVKATRPAKKSAPKKTKR